MRRNEETGFKRCMRLARRLCPYTGEILQSVKISSTGEEIRARSTARPPTSNCNFNTNTINFILYRAKTIPDSQIRSKIWMPKGTTTIYPS